MTVLYSPRTGNPYRATSPAEVTRLLSRGYYEKTDTEPVSASYDPGEHNVGDVLAYIEEHPEQADVVVAAERARGEAARVSIVGKD